jgi:transcriptional regulator with XRE-family HTH domain
MSTIGEVLEGARKRRGLPKTEAAKLLGCAELTYSMWARDVWTPSVDRPGQVDRIAEFTGLSRFQVLGLLKVLSPAEVKRCERKTG